jgi:zinc protease
MKKLMLTLAVSMIFAPAVYSADAPATSQVPPFGKDKPIPVPKIAQKTLANGMTVWVVQRKGLPRVDFVLAVRSAGFSADSKAQPNFASMLANVMSEGTTKRNSRAVAEAAQGMGGSIGTGAGMDGLTVSGNSLASYAPSMLQLLAEVTRTPSFPAKEVALAKGNALQGLKLSEATPSYRVERAVSKAVYGDHPYGNTFATADAINAVTEDMLKAEHARRIRPERTLLVITGPVTEAEGMKMAQAAFGDWKVDGPALPEVAPAALSAKPVRQVLTRAGSVQSTVRLASAGMPATSADHIPLRLTSTILGGGFSSRVNSNLRENKGYTYGASAGARIYRTGGAMVGGADVRNEVTGAAIKEYHNEYRRIGTELVSPAEMDMNKRYVAGGYLISNQQQRSVAFTLANNWLIGLPPEFLGNFVPAIQKVTAEQVREMGKKYFAPENQSIVIVGDPGAIGEQIKEYGEFTTQ